MITIDIYIVLQKKSKFDMLNLRFDTETFSRPNSSETSQIPTTKPYHVCYNKKHLVTRTRKSQKVDLLEYWVLTESRIPLKKFIYIILLNKNENATLQLSISYEKVLDKKYLLQLNNVAQTSSKRFVETQPICLV